MQYTSTLDDQECMIPYDDQGELSNNNITNNVHSTFSDNDQNEEHITSVICSIPLSKILDVESIMIAENSNNKCHTNAAAVTKLNNPNKKGDSL